MKKTKRNLSTDYFFEDLFKKAKSFVSTQRYSKLHIVKLLAFVNWFKDIN
ncbi:hypothetical protein ACPX19_04140 [Winogradskyella sp. HB-48]